MKQQIISKPRIILPNEKIDLNKWAVIACDQFTSPNETYWQKVESYVGKDPSTLNLIFPEYYLKDKQNIENRINTIHKNMDDYLTQGVIEDRISENYFIYTRRTLSNGKIRQGLVALLDLEAYSYTKGDKPAIRPTEGIVEERLPIRMKIREGAPLEYPHILMLVDDPERTLIEPLGKNLSAHTKLYDFDLMMGGGHAEGYAVTSQELENTIFSCIEKFGDPRAFSVKHGLEEIEPAIVLATGDGNHSLASAKAVWEKTKNSLMGENKQWENNPARYAMAEIINVYDDALEFEAIHRVLFNVGDVEIFLEKMRVFYKNLGSECEVEPIELKTNNFAEITNEKNQPENYQVFWLSYIKNGVQIFSTAKVKPGIHSITVGSLQMFLDDYLKSNQNATIDYLHGIETTVRDSSKEGNIGFFLPAIDKGGLFKTVAREGVTPRKTFSMGDAETKAYYIMGRSIV
ncbi:MAG: hypothetical protein UU64_C0011G0036 [candidate division WWE3 bacterium GW2011_GWF2_41_45]|nr:MAG: hypothetical protein UU55_C0012G0036 [candidate division WWE3 bacterium GW2011_GWC2_41_23]KKS10019.1 MAG: hypothetical protein UU64_C0011G0036 [candidate division WWE3 bacterium GW2011_GWF2_41_45]KKS11979.1 MAG: hypothetical protein UU68_C0007G0036 [candidate division WWE3 bacterium GW2011_GWF1_41_53]KKS19869.1 MAG: hypothetical protein UU79_C0008G0036 [candidate division WWE3 bacterium GW2011_GWE1_41_72]KKS28050.1 MAG: hypothetical protein UU86_C0014G0027 [candidate division WWE3 bacte